MAVKPQASQDADRRTRGTAQLPQRGDTSAAWRQRDDRRGFSDPLIDLIAARFRLLSDPLRLKLLAALSEGEYNASELIELTGAGQSNVSKNLAALAQGGLIRRRKVGTSARYSLADHTAYVVCDAVCHEVQMRFAMQARALGLPDVAHNDTPGAKGEQSGENRG